MFKFLSIFRKSNDKAPAEVDFDYIESPIKPDIGNKDEFQPPGPSTKPLAEQHDEPRAAKPTIDYNIQIRTDKARIEDIEDELELMVKNPGSVEVNSTDHAENPFFKEGPITEDEKTEPVTAFGFRLEPSVPGQEPGNANFSSDNITGEVTISAYFPEDIRNQLTPEQKGLFDVSDDGKTLSYPKKGSGDFSPSTKDEPPENEGYKPPKYMDNMQPREFSEDERKAEILSPETLGDMIKKTPADELVIYTGAGISKGGGEPVWDMNELQSNVKVDKGSDVFLKELLSDPEALSEAFKSFAKQINTSNPTAAHEAIKAIMDAKPGATLMTQNSDRNHEASGVRPIHMAALPQFYEFLKGQTDKASLIVAAGLHADELAFLNWAATKNPNIKIVAVDLGRSVASYPSFLDKDDYILPGDAQITLPAVAEVLKGKQTLEAASNVPASSESEPVHCDTLITPNQWGNGEISKRAEQSTLLYGTRFLPEDYARAKVDKEIREALQSRGVQIVEQENLPDLLRQNEAVIGGKIDEKRLLAELPQIAPEAHVIPSEDYESYIQHPTFPILAYIEGLGGGLGKYVLEGEDQLHKIQSVLAIDGAEQVKRHLKFKPIIETPSDRFTSYRMVTTAAGDVIAGGLLYSSEPKDGTQVADVPIDPKFYSSTVTGYFDRPQSPYYLKSKDITSNVSGGGGCIPLNPTEHSRTITSTEQEVLTAHGIEDQQIPQKVLDAAQKIGRHLGPHAGLVFGIDFLQGTDGTIYFLEANTGPGVQTINEVENKGTEDIEQGYRILMQKTIDSVFNLPK